MNEFGKPWYEVIMTILTQIVILCLVLGGGIVCLTKCANDSDKTIQGNFTVISRSDQTDRVYITDKITFHDDGMITFIDKNSENTIIMNHFIIEVD